MYRAHGVAYKTGKMAFYNPSTTNMASFASALRTALAGAGYATNPFRTDDYFPTTIKVDFYFPRPRGHYNSKGIYHPSLAFPSHAAHIQTPDIDNIGKFVLDALTGVVYKDDRCVVDFSLTKNWIGTHKHSYSDIQRDLEAKKQKDGYISLCITQIW